VKPVLLKGAANLAAGLYPGRGSRMMCDIDLLVPAHLLELCADTLLDAGYIESYLSRNDHHHHPALHRSGELAYFELHQEPVAARDGGQELLNSTELLARATLCNEGAVFFTIPPAELRAVHAIIHDLVANRGFPRGKRSLRDMYDVLLLCTRHASEISWDGLSKRFIGQDRGHLITAYMLALEDVFGWRPPMSLPHSSTRARLAHRKWLLQRRIPLLNQAVLRLHRIGVRGLLDLRRWAGYLSRRFRGFFR
ncbi:nucleotidyltransferase family protein, partial [Pseudomonadota bacterium]